MSESMEPKGLEPNQPKSGEVSERNKRRKMVQELIEKHRAGVNLTEDTVIRNMSDDEISDEIEDLDITTGGLEQALNMLDDEIENLNKGLTMTEDGLVKIDGFLKERYLSHNEDSKRIMGNELKEYTEISKKLNDELIRRQKIKREQD
jgi:hypothetical protein